MTQFQSAVAAQIEIAHEWNGMQCFENFELFRNVNFYCFSIEPTQIEIEPLGSNFRPSSDYGTHEFLVFCLVKCDHSN